MAANPAERAIVARTTRTNWKRIAGLIGADMDGEGILRFNGGGVNVLIDPQKLTLERKPLPGRQNFGLKRERSSIKRTATVTEGDTLRVVFTAKNNNIPVIAVNRRLGSWRTSYSKDQANANIARANKLVETAETNNVAERILELTGGRGIGAYGKPRYIEYPNGSILVFGLGDEPVPTEIHIPSEDPEKSPTVIQLEGTNLVEGENFVAFVGKSTEKELTVLKITEGLGAQNSFSCTAEELEDRLIRNS